MRVVARRAGQLPALFKALAGHQPDGREPNVHRVFQFRFRAVAAWGGQAMALATERRLYFRGETTRVEYRVPDFGNWPARPGEQDVTHAGAMASFATHAGVGTG